jgi:cysteine desulfurase
MAVYLDHNATSPAHREVVESMLPWLTRQAGNASALHAPGRGARAAVEQARAQVAALIGAQAERVFFTSGGTEADNLAVLGGLALLGPGARLVTSAIEHPAVLSCAEHEEQRGRHVVVVRPTASGRIEPDSLASSCGNGPCLISLMHANNETGVIQPVAEAVRAVRAVRTEQRLFHTDSVQSAGRIPVDVEALGVDLLTLSAHKMHGPQGVGALWIRPGIEIPPLLHGGGQEDGVRPGTYNVAGIVGFGVAADLARKSLAQDAAYMEAMRDRLERGLLGLVPEACVLGRGMPRLPNTINICFPGRDSRMLAANLDAGGIYVSTGSACTSGTDSVSHVHQAMGVAPELARGALRISLGVGTGEDEANEALKVFEKVLEPVRSRSRLWEAASSLWKRGRGA